MNHQYKLKTADTEKVQAASEHLFYVEGWDTDNIRIQRFKYIREDDEHYYVKNPFRRSRGRITNQPDYVTIPKKSMLTSRCFRFENQAVAYRNEVLFKEITKILEYISQPAKIDIKG